MANPDSESAADRFRRSEEADPLTARNAPGYRDAARRVLDLFELLPALDSDNRRGWWQILLALSCRDFGAADMDDKQLLALRRDPPARTVELLEHLQQTVLPVLVERSEGLASRHAVGASPEEWAASELVEDSRIYSVAEAIQRSFNNPPFDLLVAQLGHMNETALPPEEFGRLWLDDARTASWTIVRCQLAEIVRFRRY